MKKLTVDQKARLYDEAIEKLGVILNLNTVKESGTISVDDIKKIFPELKESEDERVSKALIRFHKSTIDVDGIKGEDILAWLKKQGEQKPTDWTKEDERIYQSIMEDTVQENQLNDNQTNWLRDIKYRYFPQPKQEWSEEDEKMYRGLHNLIYSTPYCDSRKELSDWLKSFKDRYTWNPSEEQMKALNYVVNLMASSASPNENDYYYNVFKDLRKQIKKLREE